MDGVETRPQAWGAKIVLDRPPVNALSTSMLSALADALAELVASRPTVVLLTAVGKCFSAGADLKEHHANPESMWQRLQTGQRVLDALRSAPFPTIAAINGPCLGGAMNIIANCDLRVGNEHASFGNPEILRGRVGGTASLRGLVTEGTIRWLAFSGESYDATDALRVGLLQKIYPAQTWESDLDRLATHIASAGTKAVYTVKEAVRRTQNGTPADGQWIEQQMTYRMTLETSLANGSPIGAPVNSVDTRSSVAG